MVIRPRIEESEKGRFSVCYRGFILSTDQRAFVSRAVDGVKILNRDS